MDCLLIVMNFGYQSNTLSTLLQHPRRLLVTGDAGFIGSNFVYYWCDTCLNDRVVVLDALAYAGNRRNLESLAGQKIFDLFKVIYAIALL